MSTYLEVNVVLPWWGDWLLAFELRRGISVTWTEPIRDLSPQHHYFWKSLDDATAVRDLMPHPE